MDGATRTDRDYLFLHNDHLGAPVVVTATKALGTGGRRVWKGERSAWGVTRTSGELGADEVPFEFPGQLRLEGTDVSVAIPDGGGCKVAVLRPALVQNWMRTYDPYVGAYLEVDPLGVFAGDTNPYAYVANSPTLLTDQRGLEVRAVYNRQTGRLAVVDLETGEMSEAFAESGGKPEGDPIPGGSYDILDHRKNDFLRLDPIDDEPMNDKWDPGGRREFRLHRPGRTRGCIEVPSWHDWDRIRDLVRATRAGLRFDRIKPWYRLEPSGEPIKRFGELTVE
jgi:uncharacterized protein RhaS with RHS repeats